MTIANIILDLTGINIFSAFSLSISLAFIWVFTDDLKDSDSKFPEWIPTTWFHKFLVFVVRVKQWKK